MEEKDSNKFYLVVKVSRWTKIRNFFILKFKSIGDMLMNKTKRKIFETAMQLFADKGYEATSIEEITATVGVAKGTLYYHFSSKEEIFNFLVEEGMKLLKNSIQIKTDKVSNYIDKIRAIILIQIKVIVKYESLITIVLSQMWGKEERNKRSRKYRLGE